MDAPGDLDCRRCGACCHGDAMWVHMVASDDERLSEPSLRRLTVLTEHGRGYVARSMRMIDGHCVALERDSSDGELTCAIYAVRPDVCRAFEAGSKACREARARLGVDLHSNPARHAEYPST